MKAVRVDLHLLTCACSDDGVAQEDLLKASTKTLHCSRYSSFLAKPLANTQQEQPELTTFTVNWIRAQENRDRTTGEDNKKRIIGQKENIKSHFYS